MTAPETRSISRRGLAILIGFALLKILLHLPVLTRYGYHPDELYFIACGEHPAFGYVDHAPLVPFIARAATSLFGESLFGLRILAVLSGAAAIFLTGLLARRLGEGGSRRQSPAWRTSLRRCTCARRTCSACRPSNRSSG